MPASSVVTALLIVAVVLAVLVAIAFQARRRGWLSAWGMPAKSRLAQAPEGIVVQASRRLSAATTAHVIAYRGHAYLIVESARGATTRVSALAPAGQITDTLP